MKIQRKSDSTDRLIATKDFQYEVGMVTADNCQITAVRYGHGAFIQWSEGTLEFEATGDEFLRFSERHPGLDPYSPANSGILQARLWFPLHVIHHRDQFTVTCCEGKNYWTGDGINLVRLLCSAILREEL